jgi:hypothetical protein
VTIVRIARRVLAPASVRCALCKLPAEDEQSPPGVVHFEVRYNGDDGMPKNPLSALTRRKYVCDSCIDAVVTLRKPAEAVETTGTIDTDPATLVRAYRRATAAAAGRNLCSACALDPDPRGPSACAACRELNRKGPLFPDLSDVHVDRIARGLYRAYASEGCEPLQAFDVRTQYEYNSQPVIDKWRALAREAIRHGAVIPEEIS